MLKHLFVAVLLLFGLSLFSQNTNVRVSSKVKYNFSKLGNQNRVAKNRVNGFTNDYFVFEAAESKTAICQQRTVFREVASVIGKTSVSARIFSFDRQFSPNGAAIVSLGVADPFSNQKARNVNEPFSESTTAQFGMAKLPGDPDNPGILIPPTVPVGDGFFALFIFLAVYFLMGFFLKSRKKCSLNS